MSTCTPSDYAEEEQGRERQALWKKNEEKLPLLLYLKSPTASAKRPTSIHNEENAIFKKHNPIHGSPLVSVCRSATLKK